MQVKYLTSFSLSTIFWATTVVAAFCAITVWIGPAGLIIFAATAVGIFIGLYICSVLDLGFAFTDLRKDIAKCLVVSGVVSCLTFGLVVYLGPHGAGVLPITWLVAMKLCWFDLEKAELFLIAATSVLTPFITALVVLRSLSYV